MSEDNKPDLDKLLKHLNEKWGNRACPMCNSNSWTVNDTVYELRQFQGGNIVIGGGPIYPIIPVNCNNCGNTVLVNALVSQAIEKPKVEPKKTKKDE
ncbi:hypothetical protein [Pontimicrobium sp. IMCC45349]|uniref:hypothetical protein n=1 Tax=Pontimicrobium sp. IMCC45349 TaxID=3391574 RepID=UPI0039A0CDC0